jgi:peptidyl-prolyl cis-trans isomerase C
MKKILALLFAASFIVSVGCVQKKEKEIPKDFLAKVNDKIITKEDFIEKLGTLPEWAKSRFRTEEGKRQFLDEIIKEELLYQEAKNSGIDKNKEFEDKLEEFKRMTLVSTLLKSEVEEKSEITDTEVRDFYEEHKETFKLGEEVNAKHILVDTQEEAEDILKKILKDEDFDELAKNFSKDHTTAVKGGDLGFFGRGRMVPEFENIAFSLKPGEVSDPVKTQFGYHIIKVIEKKEGKQREFEEVKPIVERRLKVEKQKDIFENYMSNLKASAATEINEGVLRDLMLEEESREDTSPAQE